MNKEHIFIKLGKLDAIVSSLSNIVTKEMNIKVSYRLSKLLKTLVSEHDLMKTKRSEMVQKHSKKDEDGNVINNDDKVEILDVDKFNLELEDLYHIEFQVDFEKINIEDLENVNISIQDLYNLDDFFIE